MEDKHKTQESRHRVHIDEREEMRVTGVSHVDSFDDEEVILETERGLLAVRGENLYIKHLDLEKGELFLEGLIIELVYAETMGRKNKGKGLMERLFK